MGVEDLGGDDPADKLVYAMVNEDGKYYSRLTMIADRRQTRRRYCKATSR